MTDELGQFNYKPGETVTFKIGNVLIGETEGKPVVMPIDLVENGTSDSDAVKNMTRFIMTLDADDDPSNGIELADSILTLAANWDTPDFSSAQFDTDTSTIVSEVASVYSGRTLKTQAEAKAHLENTFRCVYTGAYQGTYSGDASGEFGFLVEAKTGHIIGVGVDDEDMENPFMIQADTALNFGQQPTFTSTVSEISVDFEGKFTSVNNLTGTWTDGQDGGTLSGSRIGGSFNAKYRFTGRYQGKDYGLFTFDIDSNNSVTGIVYSASDDELSELSGSVSGSTLTATSDGATITATINLSTGTLTGGEWSFGSSESGTFSGDGCRLN